MKTIAKMQGRRIPKPPSSWDGDCPFQSGDYWKDDEDGTWHCVTPNGLLGWLKKHHVEEHEDGTISVVQGPWGSNSIFVGGIPHQKMEEANLKKEQWHGAIVKGVWVEF